MFNRESKAKDKKIEELEKELLRVERKLKKETAEREKLNHEHDKMISDLKHARGKSLDKTLKEENDRLKHEIDKITIEKEDLGTEVDRLRTKLVLFKFYYQTKVRTKNKGVNFEVSTN